MKLPADIALLALAPFLFLAPGPLAGGAAEPCPGQGLPPAVAELVEAERAFARDGVMLGQREAWLRWFAADGVMFRPGPVLAHEAMRDAEQPTLPPGAFLWEPALADVALSGDLGYSTGPVIARNPGAPDAPLRHSDYFSVWRKEPNGAWKVALDLGARVPPPASGTRFGRGVQTARVIRPSQTPPASAADLLKLDSESVGAGGAIYLPDARALRWDAEPLAGREAIVAFDAKAGAVTKRTAAGGSVSKGFDFGYTYGTWERGSSVKGHYARVWKRDESGEWKIAFEVQRADPPV